MFVVRIAGTTARGMRPAMSVMTLMDIRQPARPKRMMKSAYESSKPSREASRRDAPADAAAFAGTYGVDGSRQLAPRGRSALK
jgi:hypothetical protein